MKSYSVFLGLGSNIGERHVFLNRAANAVARIPQTTIIWASSVYETSPYGMTDQPTFLNAALQIETALDPPALLAEVKGIERRIGRTSGDRWGPREIDIDILLYEGLAVNDAAVTVPHPELEKRRFALVPLREIAGDIVHPVSGMTIEELARACSDQGRVTKTQFRIQW